MDTTFSVRDHLAYLAQEVIDNFSRAGRATTPGLVGSARETEVRRKLQDILPGGMSISTGCVIDSYGGTSNQTDVVVHEKDHCPVFSINGASDVAYIPCEGVAAVGEVKSELGTKELVDAIQKIRRVKGLKRAMRNASCFRHFGSPLVMQGGPSEVFNSVAKPSDQVFCFVLCQRFGLKLPTLVKNCWDECKHADHHLAPSVIVSLEDGIVMFADSLGNPLRNALGAASMVHFEHPAGNFQYLLSSLAQACIGGRTTDVLPHSRYLDGDLASVACHRYDLT